MKTDYTVEEAAAQLGVSASRVRQMIADGTIKAGRFANARVITKDALEVAKGRKTTPGPAPKSQAKKGAKK